MSGSCKRIYFLILGFTFISVTSFAGALPKQVLWPEYASHFNGRVSRVIYVQAGSFARKTNALRYQNHLHTLFKEPVTVKLLHQHYKVFIGPIQTASQLRQVGKSLLAQHSQHKKIKTIALKKTIISNVSPLSSHKTPLPKMSPAKNNWFISAEIGGQNSKLQRMTVANCSGFPSPNDRDIYTGNANNNQAFIGVGAGRLWQNERLWFPQYSLGIRYKTLFANATGGQVIQYSLPQFTNYNYTFKTTSQALLLASKLDIRRYNKFKPFISAGAGTVFNRVAYSEMALPGITPRISPNFAGKTKSYFTYTLGVGLNYQATQKLNFAVGYEFQDWGAMHTGTGTVGWTEQSLTQPNYRSNALLLGVDYVFNNSEKK